MADMDGHKADMADIRRICVGVCYKNDSVAVYVLC